MRDQPVGSTILLTALALLAGCRSRDASPKPEPTAASSVAAVTSAASSIAPASSLGDADSKKRDPLFNTVAEASELAEKEPPEPACGVYAHGHNIFAKPACPSVGGAAVQLTHEGRDHSPVEAPDHQMIAFVRTPAPGEGLSIWQMTRTGEHAGPVLNLAKTSITVPPDTPAPNGKLVEAFISLSFSADRKRLYFQTDGYGTSLALYELSLDTRKVHLFKDANSYMVVTTCSDPKYVDHLILAQHRYFKGPGSYDWFWLFDSKGEEIGPIGPGGENVDRFLYKRCGVGPKVADAPPPDVPEVLKKMPRRCGDYQFSRTRRSMLDGSSLDLYLIQNLADPKDIPMTGFTEPMVGIVRGACEPTPDVVIHEN
jgi:hypothetical protein